MKTRYCDDPKGLYQKCYQKETMKAETDDAVEILHRRYVKNDLEIIAELEKIRNEEEKE